VLASLEQSGGTIPGRSTGSYTLAFIGGCIACMIASNAGPAHHVPAGAGIGGHMIDYRMTDHQSMRACAGQD
jgi:hypothetical protein